MTKTETTKGLNMKLTKKEKLQMLKMSSNPDARLAAMAIANSHRSYHTLLPDECSIRDMGNGMHRFCNRHRLIRAYTRRTA